MSGVRALCELALTALCVVCCVCSSLPAGATPSQNTLANPPWSANELVPSGCPAQRYRTLPALAVDANGDVTAVWADACSYPAMNGSDVYFSDRPWAGGWSSGGPVDPNDTPTTSPHITIDGVGKADIVWSDGKQVGFNERPAGGAWSALTWVAPFLGVGRQWYPDIAVDATGTAYVVWSDTRYTTGLAGNIGFSYRAPGATWAADQWVNDHEGVADAYGFPAIAADDQGDLYAIWVDDRNASTHDIYFSYRPAGGSWEANERINDVQSTPPAPPADGARNRPALAVDDNGNAYAVWEDWRSGNYDIYFSYRPAGGSWQAGERVNDDAGIADQVVPAIAVDYLGNAFAVWQDERNAGVSDIYAAYRPAGGTWGANERINDDASGKPHGSPAVTVDRLGNGYAIWVDQRDYYDIYYSFKRSPSAKHMFMPFVLRAG